MQRALKVFLVSKRHTQGIFIRIVAYAADNFLLAIAYSFCINNFFRFYYSISVIDLATFFWNRFFLFIIRDVLFFPRKKKLKNLIQIFTQNRFNLIKQQSIDLSFTYRQDLNHLIILVRPIFGQNITREFGSISIFNLKRCGCILEDITSGYLWSRHLSAQSLLKFC